MKSPFTGKDMKLLYEIFQRTIFIKIPFCVKITVRQREFSVREQRRFRIGEREDRHARGQKRFI